MRKITTELELKREIVRNLAFGHKQASDLEWIEAASKRRRCYSDEPHA
jgi:hypothetical protein